MSHQPSTLDNVRSAAANATHIVADSLDPANETQAQKRVANLDGQSQPVQKQSYKDQLNEAANGNLKAHSKPETITEKSK